MRGLQIVKRIKKMYLNQDSVEIRLKTELDKSDHGTSKGEEGPVTGSILVRCFMHPPLRE